MSAVSVVAASPHVMNERVHCDFFSDPGMAAAARHRNAQSRLNGPGLLGMRLSLPLSLSVCM